MDTSEILESQAVKAINVIIDEHAEKLIGMLSMAKVRLGELSAADPRFATVRVRIHEEGGTELKLPIDLRELKRLVEIVEDAEFHQKSIREMQAMKAELVGDWDFTKGDDTTFRKVFGDEVNAPEP